MLKKTIEESYRISERKSKTLKIPLLKEWEDKEVYSLREVNEFVGLYFNSNACKHIRTKQSNSGLILTFLTPKHYTHIKIQPILRVKEKLEGLIKEK